jgi:hypothetical protein
MNDTNPKLIAVLKKIKAGYGVEDIEAMGIAPASYARDVISRLRSIGLLTGFLKS